MIRCVASGSTLMFRPVGLIRNRSLTTANTACGPTRRFRRQCLDHRVQELALPLTATVGRGHILRVCQLPVSNRRSRCGDRERSFLRKPTRGKRPDTPPAIPRRRQPTATQQLRARRQMIVVLTRHKGWSATGKVHRTSPRDGSRSSVFVVSCRSRRLRLVHVSEALVYTAGTHLGRMLEQWTPHQYFHNGWTVN
jgi:hypothetical protein